MDLSLNWSQIRASATVGLSRLPYEPTVERIGSGLQEGLPAERLLRAAVFAFQQQKAGFVPPSAQEIKRSIAPVDCDAYLPEAAYHLMQNLLKGRDGYAMAELLQLCRHHQTIIPASSLPALLDWGLRSPLSNELILAAGGERATWVAQQHPAWSTYLPPAKSAWETGTQTERLRWLLHTRKQQPGLAREALIQSQATEKLTGRLVAVLAIHLSEEDWPYLMELRQHKHKEIRQTATFLLSQQAEPALQHAIAPLLEASFQRNEAGQLVAVHLNDALFRQSQNLDLEGLPYPSLSLGEKTQLLCQLVVAYRLGAWVQRFALSPAELWIQLQPTEWGQWILPSWVLAAVHQQDSEWAPYLSEILLGLGQSEGFDNARLLLERLPQGKLAQLAQLADASELIAQFIQSLRQNPSRDAWMYALWLIREYAFPLDENLAFLLARGILKLLERTSGNPPVPLRQGLAQLEALMPFFPFSLYPRLAVLWAENPTWPQWYDVFLQQALERLSFRYRLHQAFGPNNP